MGYAMPKLRDDAAEKWDYALHTEVKHRILIAYMTPWITILAKGGRGLAYVDGFAGRGRYANGEPGSPLRVVEAMALHPNRAIPFTCHFVEKHPQNFANMRAEVEAHRAVKSGRIRCHFYQAAFSDASGRIIAQVQAAGQPSFFFVDPFGYTDPSMGVIRQILALPQAEVFINLMFSAIRRGLGSHDATLEHTLDRLTGTTEWRALRAMHHHRWEREFVTLYRRQLKRHGAAFAIPFRMGDDTRATTLYYLLHASKSIKAATVMKSVMTATGTPGQLGYTRREHHLAPLFDASVHGLPEYLLRMFDGQTTTYDDVIARTIEETGTCVDTHYRTCLKQMEREGRVTVKRVSSTPHLKGLRGLDEITFSGQGALLPAVSA